MFNFLFKLAVIRKVLVTRVLLESNISRYSTLLEYFKKLVTLLDSSNHFISLLYSTRVMKIHYSAQHRLNVIKGKQYWWTDPYKSSLTFVLSPKMG